MKRISVIAAGLLAAASLSARAANDDAAKMHKGEAKRHIWTSDVALEQAKLGMQGLYALADDSDGAWDKDHAVILVDNVQHDVHLAATHLAHLTNLPADRKDATAMDLTRAQTGLAHVQMALKNLEAPIRGGTVPAPADRDHGLRQQIKDTWKTLDDALSDFKKVADDYKVTTRLPTP